jgi:hypothetical protein
MADWLPCSQPSDGLPPLQDVGTQRVSPSGSEEVVVYWVGSDGTLWRSGLDPSGGFEQMPSDTELIRVAVDKYGDACCVDSSGRPMVMSSSDQTWSLIDLGSGAANLKAVDVDVATDDNSVWFVMSNGIYCVKHGSSPARSVYTFLTFNAVAPMSQPAPNDPASNGSAWGITGSKGLAFSGNGAWESGGRLIGDVVDLSTSPDNVWLVTSDGAVWTTSDGYQGTRQGEDFTASRIAGGYWGFAWAVASDGTPWRSDDN